MKPVGRRPPSGGNWLKSAHDGAVDDKAPERLPLPRSPVPPLVHEPARNRPFAGDDCGRHTYDPGGASCSAHSMGDRSCDGSRSTTIRSSAWLSGESRRPPPPPLPRPCLPAGRRTCISCFTGSFWNWGLKWHAQLTSSVCWCEPCTMAVRESSNGGCFTVCDDGLMASCTENVTASSTLARSTQSHATQAVHSGRRLSAAFG